MKIVACVIIMLDTIYLSFEKTFDHFLFKHAHGVYNNLNFIGFKENDFNGHNGLDSK